MQHDEAKSILSLCRPEHPDDRADPLIAAALEQLAQDAELRAWFEAEQIADAAIAEELGTIEVPADLKPRLLAAARAQRANTAPEQVLVFQEASAAQSPPRTARLRWAGIAAMVALLFGLTTVLQRNARQTVPLTQAEPATAVAAVAPDLIHFLAGQIEGLMRGERQLDRHDDSIEPLTDYLAQQNAPIPTCLPSACKQLQPMGCIQFDYNDCKLSLLCFKGDKVYHLITARAPRMDCPSTAQPQFYKVDKQTFKIWTAGEHLLILAVQGTREDLTAIL